MSDTQTRTTTVHCYHCGDLCAGKPVVAHEQVFCCEGCRMVYEILNEKGLCDYYSLNEKPGISQRLPLREGKFAFLDDAAIAAPLIDFRDENQTRVNLYLPQMHCSSCLWLLENLHKLNPAIVSSKVNFARKEADIVFEHRRLSLRQVAELLSSIGYEPYISLGDLHNRKPKTDKSRLFKLGVAGFCFANIMLLSFPEYLGIDERESNLLLLFRYLNVLLALPVFFYSASEFYSSAWKSLRHRFLNIDAPIVLAVWVTFARSLYEVFTGTGSGYFDSMSGIVFFMLLGRVLQKRTYDTLSFERDYTSYFPLAVTRLNKQGQEQPVMLAQVKLDDTLLIHNEELVPADGIITRGKAFIDYSFVTGESVPVRKEVGEIVYAGGKQVGGNIELLVIKEVAQSYLTRLWNRDEFKNTKDDEKTSFVHLLSRYFTWVVFAVAGAAALYWWFNDPGRIWNAVTAVLIVACPCALLLSNTFTNGNILRLLGRHGLYLRNAETIEKMAAADVLVFDKTGTLTRNDLQHVVYEGRPLSAAEKSRLSALASQSSHPLSKAMCHILPRSSQPQVNGFREKAGEGIEGIVDGELMALGSPAFTGAPPTIGQGNGSVVHVSVEGLYAGRFLFRNQYRPHIPALLKQLSLRYQVLVLSGDNESERPYLQQLLGPAAGLYFRQKPEDKLLVVKALQQAGHTVVMIGDGLNDAGALRQADAGIAVTENTNNFTPASDGILEGGELHRLKRFLSVCKANKKIVLAAFIVSVLYNIIGIYYAVQGTLSPMIAAILMPCSSISILLISFGASSLQAWKQLGRRN